MEFIKEFWQTLFQQLQNNQKVFLALVAAHTKGSPGTVGTKLWVSEEETFGTIGGGIMEYKLIARAKEILTQEDFTPEIQTLYHRASGYGEKSGLICSGSQTNLYYLCRPPREKEIIEKVISLIERDISGSLSIDTLGMSVQEKAINLAQSPIQLTQELGTWRYEEQLLNRKRIAIIGGGHCSLALSRVMSQLDYDVLVFETRHEVSTLTQNTYARSVKIVEDYQAVGALIPFPQLTCIVVMTTDFASDIRALLGVVSLPFSFIGVMGSRAKIATIFEQLQQAGISESLLSRLHAPVGLSINSHTPEEIAIAIAAQILQERRKWQNPRTEKNAR
jgi:xanthine dehydrogenase accessory factor